ncbi:RraA family protein [Actinomadura sp. KC216]|uniref:RraA family protein n=1 Tax=Actinomadura sp. KC216 TaxID=2530370 RepID=UPI0010516586|nr:RraA family protein [Actinomadura sp. KC216]TDB91093.1 RraA family protein [Actinomadura sp. KC216]
MTIDEREWRDLGTSTVSDALDRAGIAGQIPAIAPLRPSFRLLGPAFTVRYGPVGQDAGTVGDYIDEVPPGSVVVLDNQGRADVTVWGDLLTLTAHRRRLGGTVVNGTCRDTDIALETDYPIFTRHRWMRTGKDRVQVEAVQQPVNCGGVRVEPGDLLVGDADGVLAVPASRAEEVLRHALDITRAEQAIREQVVKGATLRDARAAVGYHRLQTRR